MGKVHLRHKEHEGLAFGPDGEIQFGTKGGFAPGEWIGDTDHPLYDRLIELEGGNLEEVGESKRRVYMDVLGSEEEFPSKQALLAHVRAEAKAGNARAIAYLEAQGTDKDRKALDENADATEASTTENIVVREAPAPRKGPKRRPAHKRRTSSGTGETSGTGTAAPKTGTSSQSRPSPTPDSTGPETPVSSGQQVVDK